MNTCILSSCTQLGFSTLAQFRRQCLGGGAAHGGLGLLTSINLIRQSHMPPNKDNPS